MSASALPARRIAGLAAQRSVHRAFQWLHLNEVQLRRWQLEFLAIPAPPFGEDARAHWFEHRFLDLGLDHVHRDAVGNALGELHAEDDGTGPVVLLSAHLDTVFPAGTDCTPREDGENILGPGSSDNGAGLTALLGLIAAMRSAEIIPGCTLVFAANVGEEGEGDLRGMRHLCSPESPYADRIRAVVALEGSGTGSAVHRALGSRRLRVTVGGPGGHSWADAGRPNPILALAAALVEIAALRMPHKPRTTLGCGMIRGGTSVNSIPESASADLDLRSTSPLELDRAELSVLRTLDATMARLARDTKPSAAASSLTLHVQRIGERPAAALAPSSPMAQSLAAVDRHLGIVTDLRIGSTDANLPLSLGIPSLAVGAGGVGRGVHTLAESYDPTGRELALRRILLLTLDACNLAAAEAPSDLPPLEEPAAQPL